MRDTSWINGFYRNDQLKWSQERVCHRCENKYTATARRQKYCLDCKDVVAKERYKKKKPELQEHRRDDGMSDLPNNIREIKTESGILLL